ncbi:hypothetical protein [Derxia lacustris]|uniref:hypothetical protein n=1 Tax=Derxia lacustris TaxID=764842 RepID=UPI00111C2501|nr:hypothetical protein [Derxia lacustris]
MRALPECIELGGKRRAVFGDHCAVGPDFGQCQIVIIRNGPAQCRFAHSNCTIGAAIKTMQK